MSITKYYTDIGRAIGFYPSFKRITKSTVATVFLCQILYWSDKTEDGWIWKTTDDLEEETGLTYNEQKTAKKILQELGILVVEFKRAHYKSRYKLNKDVLDNLWEQSGGKNTKKIIPAPAMATIPEPVEVEPEQEPIKSVNNRALGTVRAQSQKRGDVLDLYKEIIKSSGLEKINAGDNVRSKIKVRLHVNPDGKRWDDFVEFVVKRQKEDNQQIDTFIDWAIVEGFHPIYWTPEKMKSVWPSAFVENTKNKVKENFVERLPEEKEKVVAPMPRDLLRKRDIY